VGVGVGWNDSLTDSVAVSLGYRYVGLGRQEIDLAGPFAPTGTDQIEYDPQLHEFRVGI